MNITPTTLIQRLEQEFPGHTFSTESISCPEDFVPRTAVICDGQKLRASWSIELIQDLKAYHNVNVEGEIYNIFIEEVRKQLPMS